MIQETFIEVATSDGSSKWRIQDGTLVQASAEEKINLGDTKFRFTVPAGVGNADQLQNERIVTIVSAGEEFCQGYITDVGYKYSGDVPFLEISGEGLIRELRDVTLADVVVADTEWLDYPTRLQEHDFVTGWTNRILPLMTRDGYAYVKLQFARAMYVGARSPIRSIEVTTYDTDNKSINTITVPQFQVQYFNGADQVDFPNRNFGLDCLPFNDQVTTFTYDFVTDQQAYMHDTKEIGANFPLFWVRLWPNITIDRIRISQVRVLVDKAITTDISIIMSYASAWSLAGEIGTVNGTMQQFKGENVLSALVSTAEKTGEMFRRTDGRTVEWMAAPQDLGLALIGGRDIDPTAMRANQNAVTVTQLDHSTDSTKQITRIKAYGRGSGTSRSDMTLARSATTAPLLPSGYTFTAADNEIVNATLETALGVVRPHEEAFGDIGPMYGDGINSEQVSEEIFKKALTKLVEGSVAKETLSCAVIGQNRKIRVGELVRIDFVDRGKQLHGSYTVVGVSNSLNNAGVRTAKLQLSNYNRPVEGLTDMLAKRLKEFDRLNKYDQGQSGKAQVSGGVRL